MNEDMELRPSHEEDKPLKPSSSRPSIKFIILSVSIAIGLAVGLGVGLGVGLQNTVEVTTTKAPQTTSSTNAVITDMTTTKAPQTTSSTNAVITDMTTTKAPQTTSSTNAVITDKPTTETPAATTTQKQTTEAPTDPPIPADGPWTNFRLRESMVPSHYEIRLRPNLTTDDYTGTNKMTFQTSEATNYIIFHAHSTLIIDEASVKLEDESGGPVPIVRQFRYPDYEFYVVETQDNLNTNVDYHLTADFYNTMTVTIVGIYKSSYTDPDTGELIGIVASDFEPTDARRGYPCFDEPAMKVEYTVTIVHEQRHTALSNMPVENVKDLGNNIKETLFERSVKMSTYLSCFIVGTLDYVEAFSSRNIPLRIYGAPFQIKYHQADLALNATVAMFDKYEELFDMTYSLPKYDQVAVPEFLAGAMENWGLVTYRESNLMWDSRESSTFYQQRVHAVIGHEMVHQWFGNIVTMEWWDNIWLNEAFASYFEYRGIKWAQEDWKLEGHHLIDDQQYSMRIDQSTGSHPIVQNVSIPAQISPVFNGISYQKGSSILKVAENTLGTDLFIGGLQNYLKKYAFSVATDQDLWNAIQEYVDSQGVSLNVKELMDPWIQQFSYPVVTVTTDDSANTAVATQAPMFIESNVDISQLPESTYNYEWNIKLSYITATNPMTPVSSWLNRTQESVTNDVSGYGDWLKFNYFERGYYRVNYDAAMWTKLVNQLQTNPLVFDEKDRSQLLDDAFNLAPAGLIEYTQALDLTKYLNQEESYFVWDAYASGSTYIRYMLQNTDDYENFQKYYVTKVKPIADKLGWDATTGTHEDKRNRPTVLSLAARYNDPDALANATSLFADWKNGNYIHPDVRSLVYQYGIKAGTAEDWEYLLERYRAETVASERTSLLRGLTFTEDVELIDRLLEYARDPSIIKEQDFFTCLTYISYTITGNKMVWSWVRVNWDYMVDRFGLDNRYFGRLVPDIVENYNTDLQKWEVVSFFEANPEAGAGEAERTSVLIQIDLNIAWMQNNAQPIGQWLTDEVALLP